MSDADRTNDPPGAHYEGDGVLASLPRARPQWASPRRTAARQGSRRAPAAEASIPESAPAVNARATKRARGRLVPVEPPVPRQGFEPEDEVELGTTVEPPSGAELVESFAQIFAELALAGGQRLKDALWRLVRP